MHESTTVDSQALKQCFTTADYLKRVKKKENQKTITSKIN
jgi:hypothetical protein